MKPSLYVMFLSFLLCAPVLAAGAPPATLPEMVIDSLDGPVTPHEIKAFKDYIQALAPPKDNVHNAMVYGSGGAAAEAMGQMYEITQDPAILDRLIQFADQFLAARNDPASGRIVWTGKRERVWPNKLPTDDIAQYTGTENGDVIAHIALAAELILQSKPQWNSKAAAGDPLGYGPTYLERARTYIRECDRTIDTFILPHFVQNGTHRYYFPTSELYGTLGERYAAARGQPVPWNQQMMLNGGFQRLAVCHEITGDDPPRVGRYDQIVKASVQWFFEDMVPYEVQGHKCYKWSYVSEDKSLRHVEDMGHASYDVLVCRPYAGGRYEISQEKMLALANTVRYVIAQADGKFAWQVDGSTKKPPRSNLPPTFLALSDVLPELYPLIATADLPRAKSDPATAAAILWTKHQRQLHPAPPTP